MDSGLGADWLGDVIHGAHLPFRLPCSFKLYNFGHPQQNHGVIAVYSSPLPECVSEMAAAPLDFGNGTIDPRSLLLHPGHLSQHCQPAPYSLKQLQREVAWLRGVVDHASNPDGGSDDTRRSESDQSFNDLPFQAESLTAWNFHPESHGARTSSAYSSLADFEVDYYCNEVLSVLCPPSGLEPNLESNNNAALTTRNHYDEAVLPSYDGDDWHSASTAFESSNGRNLHDHPASIFMETAPPPLKGHAERGATTTSPAMCFTNCSTRALREDCSDRAGSVKSNNLCETPSPLTDIHSLRPAFDVEHHTPRRLSAPTLPRSSGAIETSPITDATNFRQRRWSEESHTSRPLEHTFIVVQEGKVVKTYSTVAKGVRKGPLSHATRKSSKKCRQQKSVCIRCKKDHQPCHHNGDASQPCSRCVLLGLTSKWPQPCTKAHFQDIVESGTCNYISQRAINHLVSNGSRRIRIDIPEILNLDDLISTIGQRQGNFNIRVSQADGSLFVLNLDRCCRYVRKLRCKLQSSEHNLRKFIDCDILSSGKWEECVDECDPLADLMSCLSIWGNMPSRATYSRISCSGEGTTGAAAEAPLDVEDEGDREVIIWAAQLSRIMCRKLEVDAYTHIQRVLNAWPSLSTDELKMFVHKLGLVLLTLRWRVSWWVLLGDGGTTPDPIGKEAYERRVNNLCQVLYFYYCSMLRKLPSFTLKQEFRGKMSTYADTSLPVFDDFPVEESIEGFNEWMRKGQALIVEAGVAGRLAGIGLKS